MGSYMDTLQRDYHAERTEYQEQYPQDPTGYYRATLNSLVDDLFAIQAGDYSRFDYQSFDAHLHEAGADAVGFMAELYRYLRSRLVDAFEAGAFCLDALSGGTPEHRRARGFVHNVLDELRHTPPEPLTPDDAKAVHCEIGVLLFEAVRNRITTGAIDAVAAVADTMTSEKEPDDRVTLTVAIQDFQVSRATLKRAIESGILQTFQKKENSSHFVSRSEVEKHWPKR